MRRLFGRTRDYLAVTEMTMDAVSTQFPVTTGTRLLLVDDNHKLCRMVKEYLDPLGCLPGLDGFEVLKRLRASSTIPVLMLIGRGESPDRIAGLELVADDYAPKTFSPRELLARLRAVIRRSMVTAALARHAPNPPISEDLRRVLPRRGALPQPQAIGSGSGDRTGRCRLTAILFTSWRGHSCLPSPDSSGRLTG